MLLCCKCSFERKYLRRRYPGNFAPLVARLHTTAAEADECQRVQALELPLRHRVFVLRHLLPPWAAATGSAFRLFLEHLHI